MKFEFFNVKIKSYLINAYDSTSFEIERNSKTEFMQLKTYQLGS